MKRFIAHFALLTAIAWAPAAAAGETLLVLASQPGDYIGAGQQRVITSADADFTAVRNSYNGVSISANDFNRPNPVYTFWYVDLAAPLGAELSVGAYEGATRFPFQEPGDPGLSVAGDGRGCNMSYGRFEVLEAEYDQQTGEVIRFAADFEQHCESPSAPALLGAIRFDSDVPVSIEVPPVIRIETPVNHQGCIEATGPSGGRVDLSAEQLQAGNYAYRWTTSRGRTGTGPGFRTWVRLDLPVTVTLAQTNLATQETISVTSSICASDTTPPLVEIRKPLSGETFANGNIPLVVRVTDRVDRTISRYKAFVGYESNLPLNDKGFSHTRLPPSRAVDGGTEVMIRVEALDAHGNQGQAETWVTIAR